MNKRMLKLAGLWLGVLAVVFAGVLVFGWAAQLFKPTSDYRPVLSLKHSYKEGMHYYEGVLDVPGCRNLSARYTSRGGPLAEISVDLMLNSESYCSAQETGARTVAFGINAPATTSPTITSMTLEGRALPFSLAE